MIQEYTGLNFIEIGELGVFIYKLYLHDAYIYKLSQTEKGREYLENAWILEQTQPDRKKLREHFSKGE